MRHPEDSGLTRRVNTRDQAAFLELYDRFSASIYRHALIRVGSKEVAEDVVSHTFTKAWEYLRDPEKSIQNCKAFLFRIAHNHIVDHWRDKERQPVIVDELDLENQPATPSGADDLADRALDVRWLRERLAEMPEEERRLLLWRFVDELPIIEISRLSGKSMGATYVALHRAKRLLERKVLEFRPHRQK